MAESSTTTIIMPSPSAACFTGKREKRVEFSPSLDSIDNDHRQPESPHNSGAVPWDTETGRTMSPFDRLF